MSYHNGPIYIPSHVQRFKIPEEMFIRVFNQNIALVDLFLYEKCKSYGWAMCGTSIFDQYALNSKLEEHNQDESGNEEYVEEEEKENTYISGITKEKPIDDRSLNPTKEHGTIAQDAKILLKDPKNEKHVVVNENRNKNKNQWRSVEEQRKYIRLPCEKQSKKRVETKNMYEILRDEDDDKEEEEDLDKDGSECSNN